MGRGGSNSLWPLSNSGVSARPAAFRCQREPTKSEEVKHEFDFCATMPDNLQGYRIKPHGQLVLVSSDHARSYTPSLSTSWSRTTLQGDQVPGKSHLEASFPLRCFQRLSLPHIATRQYDWRHNRYTRGASTPVLSY